MGSRFPIGRLEYEVLNHLSGHPGGTSRGIATEVEGGGYKSIQTTLHRLYYDGFVSREPGYRKARQPYSYRLTPQGVDRLNLLIEAWNEYETFNLAMVRRSKMVIERMKDKGYRDKVKKALEDAIPEFKVATEWKVKFKELEKENAALQSRLQRRQLFRRDVPEQDLELKKKDAKIKHLEHLVSQLRSRIHEESEPYADAIRMQLIDEQKAELYALQQKTAKLKEQKRKRRDLAKDRVGLLRRLMKERLCLTPQALNDVDRVACWLYSEKWRIDLPLILTRDERQKEMSRPGHYKRDLTDDEVYGVRFYVKSVRGSAVVFMSELHDVEMKHSFQR